MSSPQQHQGQRPPAPPPGGPPARRGPQVDTDPSGIVTGREADRARRQFLNYAFYKLDPTFRRLPQEERQRSLAEFEATVCRWTDRDDFILRTYSLVGLRSDADFMLWRIAHDLERFQTMQAELNRTQLAGYLQQPHTFTSLQKRSQYVNRTSSSEHHVEVMPGQGQFLFIYPFVKTRAWYALSPHARQGMMDEHILASQPFNGVRINTSYSYGIDDHDFVVAFDSDYPQEFVDLVGRLRYTEASRYTQRDTPMFACVQVPIDGILAQVADME
jgi:chlorite dismutase